jgi:hypothetical protein
MPELLAESKEDEKKLKTISLGWPRKKFNSLLADNFSMDIRGGKKSKIRRASSGGKKNKNNFFLQGFRIATAGVIYCVVDDVDGMDGCEGNADTTTEHTDMEDSRPKRRRGR